MLQQNMVVAISLCEFVTNQMSYNLESAQHHLLSSYIL